MDIATLKLKPQPAPYSKSLKVRIVQMGQWTPYEKRNTKKTSHFLKFAVADSTGVMKGVAYDMESQQQILTEGSSILIRNYLYNNDQLKLTSSTKLFKCQPISVAESSLLATSASPKKDIAAIQQSPVKQTVCIEGTIIKEEAVKSVKIGSRETKVKELTVSDTSGEVKVSLWDQKSESPVKCGDSVHINDGIVKFSSFHGENTISVSAMSTIRTIELPPQVENCEIIAVSAGQDSALDIIIQFKNGTEQECSCTKETIANYLHLDNKDITVKDIQDDLLSPLLPLSCTVSIAGKEITSIDQN